MKFCGECVEREGVLRLRSCFAARSGHFAQDDNVELYQMP